MFGFGKGKIDIRLNNYNYSPGDTIEGEVVLSLKKPLQAKELSITIIGEREITEGQGAERRTRDQTIFEFKQPLDREKEYAAGESLVYPFKIKIPKDNAVKEQVPEGTWGTVYKAAKILAQNQGPAYSSIYWWLIARLDVKGFDITKRIQVNIG